MGLCVCIYVCVCMCLSLYVSVTRRNTFFLQVLDLSQATDIWVALRPSLKQLSQFARCHEPKSDLNQNVSRVSHLTTDSSWEKSAWCLQGRIKKERRNRSKGEISEV